MGKKKDIFKDLKRIEALKEKAKRLNIVGVHSSGSSSAKREIEQMEHCLNVIEKIQKEEKNGSVKRHPRKKERK